MMNTAPRQILWFDDLSRGDVPVVGGKNASLGEMVAGLGKAGIRVPPGFATSAGMFRDFLVANGLEAGIADSLARLEAGTLSLAEAGQAIRDSILAAKWSQAAR